MCGNVTLAANGDRPALGDDLGAVQDTAARTDTGVIYLARTAQGVIWMLTIYPKNVADNIPAHVLRQIRKEVDES